MLAVRGAGGVTISGLLLLALRDDSDRHHQFVNGTLHAVLYLELALSCLQILAGLGVWQGEKWGRGPAVALCVIDLLAEAFSLGLGYGIGVSLTLGLVTVQEAAAAISVDVSVLRMLDNPDVKRWGG